MKKCPQCRTDLPAEARFCWQCGSPQPIGQPEAPVEHLLVDFDQPLEPQLVEQFFLALKRRVEAEHDASQFTAFSERIYAAGFRDRVALRAQQIVEWVESAVREAKLDIFQMNRRIETIFEDLLDQFIVQFCSDLTGVNYPTALLQYQEMPVTTINLFDMVMDYLELPVENMKFYTDFLQTPPEKLRNASKSFLFATREERLFVLVDLSLLGSAKEGFAFTDKALYWKAPFQKARAVPFEQIREIHRKEDWIAINDFFFNATPSLNAKMLRLLSKLQRYARQVEG